MIRRVDPLGAGLRPAPGEVAAPSGHRRPWRSRPAHSIDDAVVAGLKGLPALAGTPKRLRSE
jgi:hypothetical protein